MTRRPGFLSSLGAAALRHVGPLVAAPVDELGARALWYRSAASKQRSSAEKLGPEERIVALEQVRALYDDPLLYAEPDRFFGAPRVVEPREERGAIFSRDGVRAEVVELSWPSRVEPHVAALTQRALEIVENHTVHVRWFRGPAAAGGRPLAILVHGYRGGGFPFEERAWPVAALIRRGLDVALIQLPHHGLRARAGGGPRFPGSDPRMTNEGFGQAVRDLRDLVHLAKQGRGAPAVVAMGMSLGGYCVSLLATVEPTLDLVAPIIPLASLADAARDAGRLVGTPEEQAAQHVALEAVYRVASPLARPSRLAPERVLVVAAAADRITPPAHARKIAAHFAADLTTFPGGHLLQLGRAEGFRAIFERMRRLGLTSR